MLFLAISCTKPRVPPPTFDRSLMRFFFEHAAVGAAFS